MLRHVIVDNVRQAYAELPSTFVGADREDSRNGPVLVLPGPLVTSYRRPDQRVLLDPARDANPFFHLMEALWMLAGRNDVESLMRYNSGMRKYSDDGVTFHGAYGHRWRRHFSDRRGPFGPVPIDQLAIIIEKLRANPGDRRIVLQMWDPSADLGQDGLDFPCNNLCYFRVRDVSIPHKGTIDVGEQHLLVGHADVAVPVLDMTVVCRSNDMLWGGYGANAVHFSVLQEFVAAMVGARVGEMHQLSNNAHLYVATSPALDTIRPYLGYAEATVPLFGDLSGERFDEVSQELEQLWDDDVDGEVTLLPASTLRLVGGMRRAWEGWKDRTWAHCASGLELILDSGHRDWHLACREWLQRRSGKFS